MMDKATLRESDHTYWLDGKRIPISVTQLLKKHGLSANYSAISDERLQKAAGKGTAVHKEIEDYIKNGDIGFTRELTDFIDICELLNLDNIQSEVIVNNDLIAGTADIMASSHRQGKKVTVLADIKTTSVIHKESVRWQLSILEYLNEVLNNAAPFDEFYAIHLHENSKLLLLERIPREEVERLFECERNGEIYKKKELASDIMDELADAEKQYQSAKARLEKAKEVIFTEMETAKMMVCETDLVRVSYTAPSTKTTFDAKAFKAARPLLAAEYEKQTPVSASIRVTLKGG